MTKPPNKFGGRRRFVLGEALLGVEFHYGNPDVVYKLAMGSALPWGGPSTGDAGVICNRGSIF